MKKRYIGIIINDHPGLMAGILAILKSGNCFIPINTTFPGKRIRFIILDCNIKILLTDRVNYEKVRQITADIFPVIHVICLDNILEKKTGIKVKKELPAARLNCTDPAYIIYTSGSTGQPKGVVITHKNLVPLFYWFRDYFHLGVHTRVMHNLSYTFDFGVFEIFSTILFGGCFYILNNVDIGDFNYCSYYLKQQQINTLHTTPMFFSNLADTGRKMPIKLLHLGGERLTGNLIRKGLEVTSPGCQIYNGYGPTEASINCAIFVLAGKWESGNRDNIPIGRPSAFHHLYILNSAFNLQPVGMAGELGIAGPGLSQGYVNRPELTEQKFLEVQKPFFKKVSGPRRERIYRTGDLVRWLSDGSIEFLGRIDQQVKVRGFRIELEEIESCLFSHPYIKENVVISRQHENGSNYLCAYFTARGKESFTVSQLREFLLKRLPDYMIPAYFVELEKFPLTSSGKIDKNSLPEPGDTCIETGSDYIAPYSATEKKLAIIWQSLLKIKRLGVMDDFFQVGGDSILVNQCIARIREEFQAEIHLRKFFERPFIKALAEEIEKQERQASMIKPAERTGQIPLSFAQERLWFLQELDTANTAYFVPRVIRMKGKLEVSLIEKTFTEIIRRHEILRTVFLNDDGRPVQQIKPPYEFKIPVLDWCGGEKRYQEKQVSDFLDAEGQRPFDFENGPMLRAALLKLAEEEHLFVLTEHHLIHDGWTQGVLLNEIIAVFAAYSQGLQHGLPELPIQYADYAIWQREFLKGKVLDRHLNYWQEKLTGMPPVLEFPGDRPRPAVISGRGDLEIFRLSSALTVALNEFSRKNGATLFMTMLAVFKILFYRYTGVEDLCIGIPIANRRYKEMEGMLGMVINTLPLRTQVTGGFSFSQYLQHVKQNCLELYQHQDTPFGKIVEVLRPERSLSYSPIFQSLFAFMDTPGGELQLPGLELELLPSHNRSAKFDFNVVVVPRPQLQPAESSETGEILVEWEYNTDIFDAPTMKRMISRYLDLLSESILHPETRIAALPLMREEEIKRLLLEFNNTETSYPHDKTIPGLFGEQAAQTPDAIVLVARKTHEKHVDTLHAASLRKTVQITYGRLNSQSDCLAPILAEKGLLPGTIAAVMAEPSIYLINSILGILKAGAAYLPIDPGYPQDRIEYMLKDSGAKLLALVNGANDQEGEKERPRRGLHHSNLAYVIYTSGTTGRPKGTMIEHRNLVNYVHWFRSKISLDVNDRTILTSSFAFDLGYTTVFPSLLSGSRLHLIPRQAYLSAEYLLNYMGVHGISYIKVTPSLFSAIIESPCFLMDNIRRLRLVVLGGEPIKVEDVTKARNVGTHFQVMNHYGPTETTIGCIAQFIDLDQFETFKKGPTIGNPIANMKAMILDKDKNLVPMGVPGELYVSGAGVGRGYLNNPELTAEKFKFNRSYGFYRTYISFYKTGDLARWLANGTIEFLGRGDHQVKIRGFRIELQEIETRLLAHKSIKEVVVVDREYEGGDKYLCAYIVWQKKEVKSGPAELREFILEKLPEYMVPAYFVEIEKIPLTANGKLNRKLLPEPGLKIADSNSRPGNYIEEKSVEIWNDILDRKDQPVGIDDNFFQVGGHSLKAIILISRMHKEFQLNIPLGEIFKRPTIRGLAAYITENIKQSYAAIHPIEKKEYYELSSAQKRLYFLQQMDKTGTVYNLPFATVLAGELNKNKLASVFLSFIKRHESLRTSFIMVADRPVQRIHDADETVFQLVYDDAAEKEHNLAWVRAFDLAQAPLMRVELLKLSAQKHLLRVDMHHIISDGISRSVLAEELMNCYHGRELPPLRLQYKDFTAWQNSRETTGAYWQEQFADEIPVLDLPTDYPRPMVQDFSGDRLTFETDKATTAALKTMAWKKGAEEGVTLYMVLLALYYIFLAKLSNQEDIIVGTPTAGRRHADLERIIGMFVNTLALRNYPCGEKTFADFLNEIKERSLQAFENQDYQYEKLVELLPVTRDASRNPLFDTMFVWQNFDRQEIEFPGLKLTPHEYENKTAKFDLTLSGVEKEGKLFFTFEYSTKLFREETIQRYIAYFKKILNNVIENKERKIADFEIITQEEKKRILIDLNDTEVEYPKDKNIQQLFEEQLKKSPDRIALVEASFVPLVPPVQSVPLVRNVRPVSLTYCQLNGQSNRLAELLNAKGVMANTIVAIMMEHSADMIIGILGILKAGGAYLPIDAEYPPERIEYMLKDSGVKLLAAANDKEGEKVRRWEGELLAIANGLEGEKLRRWEGERRGLQHSNFPNLACIMYTSGSTGQPKGSLVTHRNVLRLVINTNFVPLSQETRILQTGALVFDAATFEIWASLLNGGQLVLVQKEIILDAQRLNNIIKKLDVNTLWLSAPLFNQLMEQNVALFAPVKYLLVGGDVLSPTHINSAKRRFPSLKIINGYGPTENTTFSLTYLIEKEFEHNIPIGRPIANSTAYIYDKSMHLTPLGITGELYVGGDGVALGYLNNPELTHEKFKIKNEKVKIKNESVALRANLKAFGNEENRHHSSFIIHHSKLYRTGDLAHWGFDGNIEFLGRIDQQVKIRGFRIELEEIESRLLNYPGIKEAVVLARQDKGNDKYLCAYFVSDKKNEPSELREYLAGVLPDYMTPSYFIQLEKIPLTTNGKIDRRTLPVPELKTGKDYLGPRNEVERKLIEIWTEILTLENYPIAIDDNFFQLGGHSLKATILIYKIHKVFDAQVPLPEIFKTPTIRELASYIKAAVKDKYISIDPIEKKEYYPLSSAQKRLYFLQQMDTRSTAYNISSFMTLTGFIDENKLEQAIAKLTGRHESLQTSFVIIADEPVQRIHDEAEFEIEKLCGRGDPLWSPFIRPFDLTQTPLLRVGLLKEKEDKHVLMVDMHHIISDGTSINILVKDFISLYAGEELPGLQVQYKDFSAWQNKEKQKESLKGQEDFWLKEFAGDLPVLELPTDYPRPALQDFTGNRIQFEIAKETWEALKKLTVENDVTMYMILLTLYNIFLARLTNQEDIVVGSPIVGRRHADLENIIGMFVNTLVLRNYPAGEKKFHGFLHEIKEKTLSAFENQDYQYEDLVEAAAVTRNTGRNPLFDTMFILQNIDIAEINIPGLEISPYPYENKTAKFDLTLSGIEKDGMLIFTLEYCTKLFKEETIDRFIAYFKNIVNQVITDKHKRIADFEIVTEEEKKRILFEFNDTGAEYPEDKTIHQLFEEQVKQTPDHIALTGYNGEETKRRKEEEKAMPLQIQMSYNQLNEQVEHLAALLIEKGVQGDTIVAIMMGRSIELISGILGILKTGGAYLPIDPGAPGERIDYILKDSGAKLLALATGANDQECEKVRKWEGDLLAIANGLEGEKLRRWEGERRGLHHSKQLAYIIYTSGSTGLPKGVPITHANIAPLFHWGYRCLGIGQGDRVVQNLSYYFDWSVWEIFITLTGGAALYLENEETHLNPELKTEFLNKNGITALHITPTQWTYLVNVRNVASKLETLKYLFIGAEKLTVDLVKRSFSVVDEGCRVFNMYGPTETTIIAAVLEIGRGEENSFINLMGVPIGKPVANGRLLVLTKDLNVCPVNIPGELYISGGGVAAGYLNNPELTNSSFFRGARGPRGAWGLLRLWKKNPLVYKTGDLVRWLADGRMEFLGRMDYQVKIRGFRIELGEIENHLMKHPGIKEAVVIDREYPGGDKYLCAYLICQEGITPSTPVEFKEYLSSKLPDYMLPSHFIFIERIPLTPNGKLDRKQLPEPGIKPPGQRCSPQNPIEEKLLEIWAEVLELSKEQIGMEDSFFELGGHSLKAVIVLAKIQENFAVQVTLAEMFKLLTIKAMAQRLIDSEETQSSNIEAVEQKEYYELSYNQKRLWLLNQLRPESDSFNIPGRLVFTHNVDENTIKKALYQVIQRHESLRTGFKMVTGELFQYVVAINEINIPLRTIDIANLEDNRKQQEREQIYEHEQKTHFDLNEIPLFRSILVKLTEDQYDFIFNVHHIITDGWSMEILKKEFFLYYEGFRTGREYQPGSLTVQYKDFAAWHNRQTTEPLMREQSFHYWQKRLAQEIPPLDLPVKPGGNWDDRTGGGYNCLLSNVTKNKLKNLAQENQTSLFTVMFTIYLILFSRLTKQEKIVCAIISAGREHPVLQDIMGFFVNSILFYIEMKDNERFNDFLHRVSEDVLASFQHQWYPVELIFKELKIKHPEVPLSFNMLNMYDEAVDLETKDFELHTRENRQDVKFAVEIYVTECKNGILLHWSYKKSLFNLSDIEYIVNEYAKLCDFFPDNITENIKEQEKKRVFKKYSKDKDQENVD